MMIISFLYQTKVLDAVIIDTYRKKIMNRSYSLNQGCPKFILNKRVFLKIEVRIFQVLVYFICI